MNFRTPEQQKELDESLIWAVENDYCEDARRRLAEGADPNAFCDRHKVPVIWMVQIQQNSSNNNEMLDILLDAGADASVTREPSGDSLLHAAAREGASGPCFQLLLAGIDPLATNRAGQKPIDAARDHGSPNAISTLAEAEALPRLPIDETLTKHALFDYNETGRTAFGNPVILTRFNEVVAQLEANGEPPITKDDLLKPLQSNWPSANFLGKASHVRVMDDVIDYLDARGESLAPEDLMSGEFPLHRTMEQRGQMKTFFSIERWQGQSPRDLQQFVYALPKELRAAIPNFSQLLLTLERDERLQGRGGEVASR